METNNQSLYNDRDIVKKQEVINEKLTGMRKHIDSYFEIDGLKFHSELLRDLMSVYMSHAEASAKHEAGYNMITERVSASMELMGFFSILYEYYSTIKRIENEVAYIKEVNAA